MYQDEYYNKYLMKKANRRYSCFSGKRYFTVFRVGDKFKNDFNSDTLTIGGLEKFQRHSNREGKVINADPNRSHLNRILIGSKNVTEDVKMYLEGVKIRSNSVVAREVILSAGNGFWDRMTPQAQELWIETNIKFIKDNFGENCVYAVLHLDETTTHIHLLLVPVFYNSKRKIATLNNSFYFGDKQKLSAWQDKYTNALTAKFQNLFIRGIRGSKATHIDLQTYYSLINEDLKEINSEVVLANAKENYLNKKKLEELQETLEAKEEQLKIAEEIIQKNKDLKEDKKLYEYIIRNLAKKYNIPEIEVYKIIENKEKNKSKQRER